MLYRHRIYLDHPTIWVLYLDHPTIWMWLEIDSSAREKTARTPRQDGPGSCRLIVCCVVFGFLSLASLLPCELCVGLFMH